MAAAGTGARIPFGSGYLGAEDLLIAAERNDVDRLEAMLDAGLSPDGRNKSGECALHLCCRAGNQRIAAALLKANANPDVADVHGRRPMHWAAYGGHVQLVETLLQKKAEANLRGATGHTPLHWASGGGHKDVCRLLVENGAEPRARVTSTGQTALHCACDKGHADVVRTLLSLVDGGDPRAKNALLSLRDKKGRTALHVAAEMGAGACVKVLLRHGADATSPLVVPDAANAVSADAAASHGASVGTLNTESSASVLGLDAVQGETPLHAACRRGHSDCVALLLSTRGGVEAAEARDAQGRTPLFLARRLSGTAKHATCELLTTAIAGKSGPSPSSRASRLSPSKERQPPSGSRSAPARPWKDGAPGGFGLDAAWLSARPAPSLGMAQRHSMEMAEVEVELHAQALAAVESYFLAMASELGEKAERARAKSRRQS